MKKIFFSLLLLVGYVSNAQEITQQDALRYATTDLTGTARFRGMSGAFGALGGDLSAINVNPAGSVLFNNNFASFSGTNFNTKNKSDYFGNKTKDNHNTLDLNQIGAVLVFNDQSGKSNWKKFSLALNYENVKNFDNSIYISGTNPTTSINEYFVRQANLPINDFTDSQFDLAASTYLISEDSNNPGVYLSNVPDGGNYRQAQIISTSGYNSKVTANFATSYKDLLFLGASLNGHFTDYTRSTSLAENNNNNPNLGVQSIRFDNQVYTYGTGFSMNIGAIVQPTKSLRLGLAYESPTWYRLNDELTQYIEAVSTDGPDTYYDFYDPNIINIYPTYKLQTPSKFTGSAAYIFGNKGLISLDVATKDYGNTAFKPRNISVYSTLNDNMDLTLTRALELRLGGEYKFKQFSFRGGYRFEESPYKVDYAMGDLTGYSGGIGYNFGHNRLDFAYAYSHRNYNQYLISSGMNDTARIRAINNNFTLTYSINF